MLKMRSVNILQAKSSLSRLVEFIEQGKEMEIVITRNGHPVAKLVPINKVPVEQRVGMARGEFELPDSIDAHKDEVSSLFTVTP